MVETWRYRGPEMGSEFTAHPPSSRWKLSRQLCEALGWKQVNGAMRDAVSACC
jgi:hypothetical protein